METEYKQSVSFTAISIMQVPRRPQPSFTPLLPHPAPLGAAEQLTKKDPMEKQLLEKEDGTTKDQTGEEKFSSQEETLESGVAILTEAPAEDAKAGQRIFRYCSQESFPEQSSLSEERLDEDDVEARRRAAEEEAAAKERAAQRQQLAIEELVESERSYLRLLQLSTVTIRNNLQQLQVGFKTAATQIKKKDICLKADGLKQLVSDGG